MPSASPYLLSKGGPHVFLKLLLYNCFLQQAICIYNTISGTYHLRLYLGTLFEVSLLKSLGHVAPIKFLNLYDSDVLICNFLQFFPFSNFLFVGTCIWASIPIYQTKKSFENVPEYSLNLIHEFFCGRVQHTIQHFSAL